MTSIDKKYKIKFKSEQDNFIKYVSAKNIIEAIVKFYSNVKCYDILYVELVED